MTKDDIKDFRIFKNILPDGLDDFFRSSNEITFPSDAVIMEEAREGPDSDIYIILDGRVKIQVGSPGAQVNQVEQKQLAILKKGDILGERGLLQGKYRSARATAYGDVTALKINREKLLALFDKNPRQGYIFMSNLATILSERIVDLIFMWRNDL
jgi:CRP-like cAMP-binding protein